ncbi:nickel-binding protein [Dactylosporangium sp. NPDC000244]|uniref:nickel-binding protein n=1 Tax=Dactylosporangium sp. NPDC000244 TaxID=3154365 RepID=UPI00332C0B1B
MPLYMDIHSIEGGVSVDDVVKAHMADLRTQGRYDVSYLRYWVDEAHGKIFCLAEAPTADAAAAVHREAHGLVAGEIYQVQEGS